MEITLSYKQLVGIGVLVGVLALGIGVVKAGELNGNGNTILPFQQSQQTVTTESISQQKSQQDSAVIQKLLEINAEIEGLRIDLNAMKSATMEMNPLKEISKLQSSIAALEKRVQELSNATEEAKTDNVSTEKVEQLYGLLAKLEDKMGQMEKEIKTLKETPAQVQELEVVTETEDVPDQQVQEVKVKALTVSTNRVEYMLGEIVTITGKTDPEVPVNVQIADAHKVIFTITTESDNIGLYKAVYEIQDDATAGTYTVTVSSGDKSSIIFFKVNNPEKLSAYSQNGLLKLGITDSVYSRGDYVSVTGEAPPRGKIAITITPPSGNESTVTVFSDSDGKFQKLFQLSLDASDGDWTISATHYGETASLTIKVL